jgi:hypothetical protein
MSIDQHIIANDSDADALAAYVADPDNYKPVLAPAITSWLGTAGRLAKLKAFLASDAGGETGAAVRNGIDALLLAISAPGAQLELQPGSGHRELVDIAAMLGVLSESDVADLIGRAFKGQVLTLGDVAARRAAMARESARATLENRLASFSARVLAAFDDAGATPADDTIRALWTDVPGEGD